jgi:hypothetical protein
MRNEGSLRICTLVGCLAFSSLATAQAAPVPSSGISPGMASGPAVANPSAPVPESAPSPAALAATDELMSLQEDTLILKAQLKKLEVQTDVAQRQETLGRMGRSSSNDEVSVVATQSLGNTMIATLNTNDGSEFDVRPGDVLPNGMRVVSIRPGVVVLDSHDRRTTLTVSSTRSREPGMAAGNGMSGGVPPIPTLPMLTR